MEIFLKTYNFLLWECNKNWLKTWLISLLLMLMLSRSDMIWTMPVLRCHFQIEAIQMKLRWRKKIVLLPSSSEWCTTVEVDPMSKKLPSWYTIQNGFGAKNSKILSPLGLTPPYLGSRNNILGPLLVTDFTQIWINKTCFIK